MSLPSYQRMVIGYHGCDAELANRVLLGKASLTASERDYDWLGRGIYFWEHGPQRAYDWAKEKSKRNSSTIRSPAVLGAYINLGECFDLLDTANTGLLSEMYPVFRQFVELRGEQLPTNKKAPGNNGPDRVLHYLDCAVLNWSLDEFAKHKIHYQTVRGVFQEGALAYPGTDIKLKSHIQIAVRDPHCILGVFRPNPIAYQLNRRKLS